MPNITAELQNLCLFLEALAKVSMFTGLALWVVLIGAWELMAGGRK
jgi:hypothetical protein